MPATRKSAKSRHKVSFAVDRSEIDISSDWVQAVMEPPPARTSASPTPDAPNESVSPAKSISKKNTATVEAHATVADAAPVENNAAVALSAAVEKNTAVENKATEAENATGALFGSPQAATVVKNTTVEAAPRPESVTSNATVVNKTTAAITVTVANNATVVENATVEAASTKRAVRLRPIQRITDGLTPGQYAVYSLMFDRGEARDVRARLFRGGYVDLVRLTGLSKRGIQNVIAELQAKAVISIHQPPGYHRTQTTIYEVYAEQAVLDRWFAKGLRYSSGKSKNLITITTVE